MDVGSLSPDGYYSWSGEKWIPIDLAKVSEDGFWIWNGSEWIPNPNAPKEEVASTEDSASSFPNQTSVLDAQHHFTQPIIQQTTPQQMVYFQQQPRKSSISVVSIVLLLGVLAIAVTVVLSGVLYVWASSLAEESQQDVAGTWYNPQDTMTLYPNGTVTETSNVITSWSSNGYNLTTTLEIDGEEMDLVWRYAVKIDSDGDRILFLAYYEVEDGVQTEEIGEDSCVAYSDSIRGAESDYFTQKVAIFPAWCDPDESE